MWGGFIVLILFLLALDLGVLQRKSQTVTTSQALKFTCMWVGLALCFAGYVYYEFGPQKALEFLTGYLVEESLSVDNIFVFLVIFSYFSVPAELQRPVLFWGVLGAIILRAIFITIGAVLMHQFHWIIYVFGAFLVYTGYKILTQDNEEVDPDQNPFVKLVRRYFPLLPEYHGAKFFVMKDGKRYATPLLLVLVAVEATDVVFAVDSIPAIFAVTPDPFIVFTSNIFAILGLRSLYFLLADFVQRFHYLKYGLGLVLSFIGVKMLITEFYKIPIGLSLGVVVSLLAGSVIVSLVRPPKEAPLPEPHHANDPAAPVFPEAN